MNRATAVRPEKASDLINESAPHGDGARGSSAGVKTTVIQPRAGWQLVDIRELWEYRELLSLFVWRDIKLRFRQTLLGVVWIVLPPVITMILFTIIFGKLAKFPTGGVPYPIFVFAGLLPWDFFTGGFSAASGSVTSAGPIIHKVYFPRLLLPIARVSVTAVDLCVRLGLLIVLMIYYQYPPGPRLLLIPLLVVAIAMFALGIGTFFAAWNVSFRDAARIQSYIIKFGLFLTPAIYMDVHDTFAEPAPVEQAVEAEGKRDPAQGLTESKPAATSGASAPQREDAVPDQLQMLMELNPMMGIVSAFRAAILNKPLPWPQLSYSLAVIVIVFTVGCLYFERVQRGFADVI